MSVIEKMSKHFGVGKPKDCFMFLAWFLNQLSGKIIKENIIGKSKITTLTPNKETYVIDEKE